jgi:hypothetical protein
MVEKIAIINEAQWLALRKEDVTASVAGALLGVHEYTTAYGLWAQKTGALLDGLVAATVSGDGDTYTVSDLERGRLLEPEHHDPAPRPSEPVSALDTDAIDTARENGRTAAGKGVGRRAVPGDYRDNSDLAAAWQAGWDEAKGRAQS